MGRGYTAEGYLEFVDRLREERSDFNLTTDIMVGFPGETEKDFAASCEIAEKIGFSHIHTFPFSIREGTRAATMKDQIPLEVKTERARAIRRISDEGKIRYRSVFIGKKF